MSSYLYLPLMRSAALRKMAARSAKGIDSHDDLAASAESMAFVTSSGDALDAVATMSACEDGLDCDVVEDVLICIVESDTDVRRSHGFAWHTSLPPITSGTSSGILDLSAWRAASRLCLSGDPFA